MDAMKSGAPRDVKLPNPSAMALVAQKSMQTGFDKLQETGNLIRQKRIDSDVGTVLSGIDASGMSPEQYQKALFSGIAGVEGVNATEALGLASKLSKPVFDARDYTDSRRDADDT